MSIVTHTKFQPIRKGSPRFLPHPSTTQKSVSYLPPYQDISPNECRIGKINPPPRPLPLGIRRPSREDGCNDTLGDRFASLGDEARLHLIRNPPYLPGHYFTHYLFILASKRREEIPLRATGAPRVGEKRLCQSHGIWQQLWDYENGGLVLVLTFLYDRDRPLFATEGIPDTGKTITLR